jgi:hypothetical protein
MKKTIGMICALMMMGFLLGGCYSKCCGSCQQTSYKGEG